MTVTTESKYMNAVLVHPYVQLCADKLSAPISQHHQHIVDTVMIFYLSPVYFDMSSSKCATQLPLDLLVVLEDVSPLSLKASLVLPG